MASIADLTAAVTALTDDVAADATAAQAVLTAVTNLEALVDSLRSGSGLSAADQQALDEAVAGITTATTGLVTQTGDLSTAASGADTTLTPPAA